MNDVSEQVLMESARPPAATGDMRLALARLRECFVEAERVLDWGTTRTGTAEDHAPIRTGDASNSNASTQLETLCRFKEGKQRRNSAGRNAI